MTFSDSSNGTGIVEQVRAKIDLDANQYSTVKIMNSANNWLDVITGYAIGADRRFAFDDSNQSKLPVGVTTLTADQREYSFLTDEQGNRILTLTRIDVKDSNGNWRQLQKIDQTQISPMALDEFMKTSSMPLYYDSISDNVIRLYPASNTTVSAGLKFYFQRSPSYFVATDTTKEPGVASTLHEGFVWKCAYDACVAKGLPNIQPISIELERERTKMVQYFENRNKDESEIVLRGRSNQNK